MKRLKTERTEICKDPKLLLILDKLLVEGITKLEPIYNPKKGYRYPVVEAILGDSSNCEEGLTQLFKTGILKRQIFDKMIYCPRCNSANSSIRYCCPYCNSFNIQKSSLIEHIQCGYIDAEDKFKLKDKLVCLRCHNQLNKLNINYRKAGIWCSCNDCGKSFDIAVPSHFCRECRQDFTFEDAFYKDVYSYTLNESAMKEKNVCSMVSLIRELLQSRGFTVESPGFLKGKSGANHRFDIVASKSDITRKAIAIDTVNSTEDEVTEQPVIEMFAKVYDTTPRKSYLVSIPHMSENGKKLADLYKITLIEAKSQNEALKELGTIICD